jgi:hypothetical protein
LSENPCIHASMMSENSMWPCKHDVWKFHVAMPAGCLKILCAHRSPQGRDLLNEAECILKSDTKCNLWVFLRWCRTCRNIASHLEDKLHPFNITYLL